MKYDNLMVSVSGGLTSMFLAIFLKNRYPNKKTIFLFANTGKEKNETYDFLHNCSIEYDLPIVWLQATVNPIKGVGTSYEIVDYKTANREGKPFEDVIKKYGLPSKMFRHCTRELKERPIHAYAKSIFDGDYVSAIGIRADEKHRLTNKKNHWYPLSEMNITKQFINDWWKKQPVKLGLSESEGNCDFCFLKSKRKRLNLLRNGLDVDWWNRMELNYGTDKQPIFDVRNGDSIHNLIELNNKSNLQLSLIDDVSFDCFCKS